MEKIEKYSAILLELLKDYERPKTYIETYIVTDLQKHHYQVLRMGWTDKDSFVLRIVLYFQIKEDGKIWILANWTEDDIETILVEKGIPKSDIVLGTIPESIRHFTGFAVA